MNSTSVSDAFLRLLRFTPYPSRLTIRVNNFPPHPAGPVGSMAAGDPGLEASLPASPHENQMGEGATANLAR